MVKVPYSEEQIRHLTYHLAGEARGFNYLFENGPKEFLPFSNAIRGDEDATRFLEENKFGLLLAFSRAVNEDKAAFVLLKQHFPEWAALANLVNGDDNAAAFLVRVGKSFMVDLGLAIQAAQRNDNHYKSGTMQMLKSVFNFGKSPSKKK